MKYRVVTEGSEQRLKEEVEVYMSMAGNYKVVFQ